MKIKGKGLVRMEQLTCRVLLLVSVISFTLCFVMEYFFPLWIGDYYCRLIHLEFLKNVMLGITGSAIISFVCVIFPYLKKKNDFLKTLLSQIETLLSTYLAINACLNQNRLFPLDGTQDNIDTYEFEIRMYKASQDLLNKIDAFASQYRRHEWSIRELDDFYEISMKCSAIKLQLIYKKLNT